jgi:hypothetical protein
MMKKRIKQHTKVLLTAFGVVVIALCSFRLTQTGAGPLQIKKGAHIVLIGNNLGSRMMNFGHFETEMQLRYPDSVIPTICSISAICAMEATRPGSGPMPAACLPGPFRARRNSRPSWRKTQAARVSLKRRTNGSAA